LDLKKTGSYYENPLKIPLKAEESDDKTMKPEDFKQNDSPYMIKSKKVKKISSFLEKSGFFRGKVSVFN